MEHIIVLFNANWQFCSTCRVFSVWGNCWQNKQWRQVTLITGKEIVDRVVKLLEQELLPIAVNNKGKKVLLIQEFFEANNIQGQGIEGECYPVSLLILIPRLIFGLIILCTNLFL